jgi:hypothetical protein
LKTLMSTLANIVIVASLLCPVTLAKVCGEGGSCDSLHDETSLLQVGNAVKRGHGRGHAQDPGNSAEASLTDDSEKVDIHDAKVSSEDDLGEDEYLGSKSDTLCMNTKYIRIGAGDYFRRANAQKATLGEMGNYQDGYFQSQTMDFQDPPNPAWLDPHGDVGVEIETHIDMSSSEVSSFSAQASAAGKFAAATVKANGGVSGSHSATAGFKMVVLRFKSRRALLESLNKDASRRHMLKNYGSPRIVLTIMRLETAGDFADNDCLSMNGGASGGDATGTMTATASGTRSSCAQMTASFSPGTVIAYRLGTPVFSGDTITRIDIAQPCSYLNPSCGCNQFITR